MAVTTLEASIDPTGALSQLDLNTTDIGNIIDQFNQLQNQLNGGNITQNEQNIIVFDNTTNRVLIGYQTVLQAWGLFVSKVGIDVTAATASQLIFNSNQDTFKIVSSGSVSFAVGSLVPGASTTSVVAHGQTGVPAVIAFVNGTGSTYLTAGEYYSVSVAIPVAVGGVYQAGIVYYFTVDTVNITFIVSNYTSLNPVTDIGTAVFKYYILQETASS